MRRINASNDNQSQLSQRVNEYENTNRLLTKKEENELYEEFINSVRNDGFETKQQKDNVVKKQIEKMNTLVRRKNSLKAK